MKITATQLKKIIAEEIKRAQLDEQIMLASSSAKLETLLDVVCGDWKSQFDPMDPSMDASGGKPVWEAQCDAACEVLGEKIDELIMQVEEDLHTGQFYSETSMP